MPKDLTERQKRAKTQLSSLVLDVPFVSNDSPSATSQSFFGDALFNGEAPARRSLFGNIDCPTRVEHLSISESNPQKLSGMKCNLRREQPILQDPTETFDKMNAIMHQTLKYVKDVESINFSSSHIIDYNGEPMNDPRRAFLSICTSVLANFSFCQPLNPTKLLNFLSDLYDNCPTENAYHNTLHAADSVQMLFLILREKPSSLMFTDDEVIVCFLATLCISFVHPGVTNAFLARIDHPLTLIYGDMTTQHSASLTVFLYLLNREENRFIDLSASSSTRPFSQFMRELLVETVLGSAPRQRATLMRDIQDVEAAKFISHRVVPHLITAVVVLADHAVALRPRPQFIHMATRVVGEWLREACEEERRGLDPLLPDSRRRLTENGLSMVAEYCAAWVKPLAAAVHALVPQDLYDNVEKNAEPPSVGEAADFAVPPTSPDERWADGSAPVVEILRKITTHATSLDRKASKRAILNATSTRGAISSISSIASSPRGSQWDVHAGVSDSKEIQTHHGRSEHYFSFLRLYDTYERDGKPAAEFAAQLVFLALQLSPNYIGQYAKEGNDVGSKEQCDTIARRVMEKEEAPSTAEVIASPTRNEQQTDGFILQLMEMYAQREAEKTNSAHKGPPSAHANTRPAIYCHNPVYGNTLRNKKS